MTWRCKVTGTFFAVVFTLGPGLSGDAFASLILSEGQTATFDFDLSGQTPGPPYDFIKVQLSFGGGDMLGVDEVFFVEIFGNIAGASMGETATDDLLGSGDEAGGPLFFELDWPLDGVIGFMEMTMLSGSVDLMAVRLFGVDSSGAASKPGVDAILRPVPEPSVGAMWVLGLAWIAYLRRRRKLHAPM